MPQRKGSRHVERDAAIVAALRADPYLTLEAVAKQHNITRERVHQIWTRDSGESSARRRPPRPPVLLTCSACGAQYERGKSDEHRAASGHNVLERNLSRNAEWARLYVEDGLSTIQIGRIYNVRATDVRAAIQRRGVKLRPLRGGIVVRPKHV